MSFYIVLSQLRILLFYCLWKNMMSLNWFCNFLNIVLDRLIAA